MSTIKITLRQYKRKQEVKWQRDITWTEICTSTGVSSSTLNRLLDGHVKRLDLSVLARLCEFFEVPPGPIPFITYERPPDQRWELLTREVC